MDLAPYHHAKSRRDMNTKPTEVDSMNRLRVQAENEAAMLRDEVLAVKVQKAQLFAALRFIVDRDLSYLDGYVAGDLIPRRAIEQGREILRITADASPPTSTQ